MLLFTNYKMGFFFSCLNKNWISFEMHSAQRINKQNEQRRRKSERSTLKCNFHDFRWNAVSCFDFFEIGVHSNKPKYLERLQCDILFMNTDDSSSSGNSDDNGHSIQSYENTAEAGNTIQMHIAILVIAFTFFFKRINTGFHYRLINLWCERIERKFHGFFSKSVAFICQKEFDRKYSQPIFPMILKKWNRF